MAQPVLQVNLSLWGSVFKRQRSWKAVLVFYFYTHPLGLFLVRLSNSLLVDNHGLDSFSFYLIFDV